MSTNKWITKSSCRLCVQLTQIILIGLISSSIQAQDCPYNIDFETGTFEGWTCYVGSAADVNGKNVITISATDQPIENRQTMYSYAKNAGEVDPYGFFPVVCPNGSKYSIRLGNNLAGTQAEGISYTFTIPADKDVYSLIYHYAVVFQDPNHLAEQQPRMETEITNMTDNQVISCSSFTFIPYGTILPGFVQSTVSSGDAPVWCKDWSAVSVNLNGMAGKTIRLFFKTADCTFRKHFGYAYIDVNSQCGDAFVGANFCPDDTAVNVTAPFGYQNYAWFNGAFTKKLGNTQTIRFAPPPTAGTDIAVELTPYNGYGCLDTLHARLVDTLTILADAGRDTLSCNHSPVVLGNNSVPGYVYSWSPTDGLNNSEIADPIATPDFTTSYVVTTRHDGGGCLSRDTVLVTASVIDSSIHLLGKAMYCDGYGDSSILVIKPTSHIQWYKDNLAIDEATEIMYRATQSGTYYAQLINNDGCAIATQKQQIIIDKARPGTTYPLEYAVINQPLQLQARTFGTTVNWLPGSELDKPSDVAPIFRGDEDELYDIKIETATGCITIDTQLVKVVNHAEIYVPTAFSPNRDGKNDVLRPILMGVQQLVYFRVYNRFGQLLFESKTNREGWDGNFDGRPMPTQVVVWVAEGTGADGKIYARKGTSTLVR